MFPARTFCLAGYRCTRKSRGAGLRPLCIHSYGNPVKYIDPSGHYSCLPSQCGYIHDYDEGWSPVKDLIRLRSLYGEFAEVAHIETWASNYNPETDPYLAAAREGDIAGIWASDLMAIERRAGWERDPEGTAKSIFLNLLGGLGEGIANNLPQFSALLAVRNPYGRLGGPAHSGMATDLQSSVERVWGAGYSSDTEFLIETPGGMRGRRYMDVVVLNPLDVPVAFYQVGLSTQAGQPIAREIYAINDVVEYSIYSNLPIFFFPYR